MRRKRIEHRPNAHVHGIPRESRIQPAQGRLQLACGGILPLSLAAHLLHQAVQQEAVALAGTGHQRIAIQLHKPDHLLVQLSGVAITRWNGDLQEGFGDRLRRQPGQPAQQRLGPCAQLLEGREPGGGHARRVLHQLGVEPAQHLLAALLPVLAVAGEGNAALIDVGAGLLQRQRQAIEVLRQFAGRGGIIGFVPPVAGGALQQECRRRLDAEHLQGQALHRRAPFAQPCGEEHLAAADLGKQRFHRLGRWLAVDAIKDQQPARMGAEPADHGLTLDRLLSGVLLRQVEHSGQTCQGAVQRLRGTGRGKEHGAVAGGVAPGMLDRQPRLAHTAHADQRHRRARGGGVLGDGAELLLKRLQVPVAALEQLAQGRIGQCGGLVDLPGGGTQLQEQRTLDLPGEVVDAAKAHLRIRLEAAQPGQVLLLEDLLLRIAGEAFLARGLFGGNTDQQLAAVQQRQPGLPLRVGERWPISGQEPAQGRQTAGQIGVVLVEIGEGTGFRPRSQPIPHQVDHRIALADVEIELVEGRDPASNEVFLDLDGDIR